MNQEKTFEEQLEELEVKYNKQQEEPLEGLQILTSNCCYSHTHPENQFMDFKVLYKGNDITKSFYGKKPPVDWAYKGVRISDGACQ